MSSAQASLSGQGWSPGRLAPRLALGGGLLLLGALLAARSIAPQLGVALQYELVVPSWISRDSAAGNAEPGAAAAAAPPVQQQQPSADELQQLQPGVHGYVRKAGMAERLAWSHQPHYAVARAAIFDAWRANASSAMQPALARAGQTAPPPQPLSCSAARHPPVPHPHCHVFVNHQYRVAYIRSPKSSSTSIMDWMGQCGWNKTRNWNATTCLDYSWEKHETPTSAARIWADYFVFGFVRNPWARAYSLYKDMTSTGHFLAKHGPRCRMEWPSFCADPWATWQGLVSRGCNRASLEYGLFHMADQYHCMVTPSGAWAVDFVGRVEAGDEDWRVVVAEMNRRRRPGVPAVNFASLSHSHMLPDPRKRLQQRGTAQRQQHQAGDATAAAAAAGVQPPAPSLRRSRSARRALLRGGSDGGGAAPAPGSGAIAALDWWAASCGVAGGPYCGRSNAHCREAVARTYACDVQHFDYAWRGSGGDGSGSV